MFASFSTGEPTDHLTFSDGENPISIACFDGRYGWVHGLNMWKIVDLRHRRVLADVVFPLGPPIGAVPNALESKQGEIGGFRALWFGVNPDSSVLVVPLDSPGAGLLPGVAVGTEWYCSPEHLAAWMAAPVTEGEQRRLRRFLAEPGGGA